MTNTAGAFKLHLARGAASEVWKELASSSDIPMLRSLADAGPNDCVIDTGGKILCFDGDLGMTRLSPWLMNGSASEVPRLPGTELERRLRREGVPARITEGSEGLSLTVAVWGFEALEIRRAAVGGGVLQAIRSKGSHMGEVTITDEHPLWKHAEKLAVRAIYALGLDFGQVAVRINDKGRLAVTDVFSDLRLYSQEGKRKLRDSAAEFANEWANETSGAAVRTLLGADPEFILLSSAGRVVPASRYFPRDGEAGCDSMRVRGEKIWPLVELRPRPCREPAQLAAELRSLLLDAAGRTGGAVLSWRAGALPVPGIPLGGHVHLSGAALHAERLRALDNVVALPLRLLEPPGAASRRPRYGALGDVRRQAHGGFEYRTPPSWLVSPRLTLGVFALAKTAAEHSREIAAAGRPLDEDSVRDAFYEGDRATLLAAAERVHRAIAGTAGYAAYREPIRFVFDSIERGRSWNESADIRDKWRIPIH